MSQHDKDPLIEGGKVGRGKGKPFGPDNKPTGRAPRGPQFRTLLLEALKTVKYSTTDPQTGERIEKTLTEADFIQRGIEMAMKDPSMYRDILARLIPYSRPTMPQVQFDFDPNWTPNERIDAIMKAVAAGEIAVDVAHSLIDIFKKGAEVQEISGILERLAELETRIDEQAEAHKAAANAADTDESTEAQSS